MIVPIAYRDSDDDADDGDDESAGDASSDHHAGVSPPDTTASTTTTTPRVYREGRLTLRIKDDGRKLSQRSVVFG